MCVRAKWKSNPRPIEYQAKRFGPGIAVFVGINTSESSTSGLLEGALRLALYANTYLPTWPRSDLGPGLAAAGLKDGEIS